MNDEELTPVELDDMRARLVSGAKRIKPAGRHLAAVATGAVALVLVAVVTAGAFTAAGLFGLGKDGEPVASPSVAASPAVTVFGGECENALTTEQVSDARGVQMVLREPTWRSGAEGVMGGIACTWLLATDDASPTVMLMAYPVSVVPDDVKEAPTGCNLAPMALGCTVSGSVGSTWLFLYSNEVASSPDELASDTAATQALWQLAASNVTEYSAPQPQTRTSGWRSATSCEELVDANELTKTTGWVTVTYNPLEYGEGYDPSIDQWRLPERVGDVTVCVFEGPWTGSSSPHVRIRVIPGAATFFPQIASSEGATAVSVAGAAAAVDVMADNLWIGAVDTTVASDGVNLVIVGIDAEAAKGARASIASIVLARLR